MPLAYAATAPYRPPPVFHPLLFQPTYLTYLLTHFTDVDSLVPFDATFSPSRPYLRGQKKINQHINRLPSTPVTTLPPTLSGFYLPTSSYHFSPTRSTDNPFRLLTQYLHSPYLPFPFTLPSTSIP